MIIFILPRSRYLNAIQTMCPHILRYLTTAIITNKDVRKRRQVLKDLVKVIQQVTHRFCVGSPLCLQRSKVKGRLLTTSPNGSANTFFPAQAVCVQMYFIHCIILNIGVLTNT